MDSIEQTTTALTTEQKRAFRRLHGSTPIVALPHGGMGKRSETVEDVLATFDHVVEYLRLEMTRHELVRDELNALKADLAAAGRVLKLVTEVQP